LTAPYRPFRFETAKKPEEKAIRFGIAFSPGLRAAYLAGFEMVNRLSIFPPIVIEETNASRASVA
jgi:hypothetical protein